jgi:hypothetical protein
MEGELARGGTTLGDRRETAPPWPYHPVSGHAAEDSHRENQPEQEQALDAEPTQ